MGLHQKCDPANQGHRVFVCVGVCRFKFLLTLTYAPASPSPYIQLATIIIITVTTSYWDSLHSSLFFALCGSSHTPFLFLLHFAQ